MLRAVFPLTTNRLSVRFVRPEDWRAIREIWLDFNASSYSQYDTPHSTEAEEVRRRIVRWAAHNGGIEHLFFVVCHGESVIGYVAFNLRETGYEIGYCFHSDYHGKGYAKESIQALLGVLWMIDVRRITAGTALANTPSVRLLQSLGFRQVGAEKVSFYRDPDGKDIFFDGGIFELIL